MVTKSKVIAVEVIGTGAGTVVYLYNLTSGDRWKGFTDSQGHVLIDLLSDTIDGNNPTAWVKLDIIECVVNGNGYGYATLTLNGNQDQEIAITLTTDDGPIISI